MVRAADAAACQESRMRAPPRRMKDLDDVARLLDTQAKCLFGLIHRLSANKVVARALSSKIITSKARGYEASKCFKAQVDVDFVEEKSPWRKGCMGSMALEKQRGLSTGEKSGLEAKKVNHLPRVPG